MFLNGIAAFALGKGDMYQVVSGNFVERKCSFNNRWSQVWAALLKLTYSDISPLCK